MKIGIEGLNSIDVQEKNTELYRVGMANKSEQPPEISDTSNYNGDPAFDEYVPSNPIKGIYSFEKGSDGIPRIDYLDPHLDEATKKDGVRNVADDSSKSDSTTTNTDEVDREIKELKEKKAHMEQELRTADDSRKKELERELQQVEMELTQKDNDTYRRQNATIL